MVCRFIRPRDWSPDHQRPRASAFKDNKGAISVWHLERLQNQFVPIGDLLIGHLAGSGQAHHQAGDYTDLATHAAEQKDQPLQAQVQWRPEDEHVTPPWRQWSYAHAQVETNATQDNNEVMKEFRRLLAMECRTKIAPDGSIPPSQG